MAKKKLPEEQVGFIACAIKQLPKQDLWAAYLAAVDENPANAPPPSAVALLDKPERADIAALATKWWKSTSVKLGVAFLDGGPADLQARIISHMNAWGERANVKFSPASSAMAQVRIVRTPGEGYASYLGTDILQIPVGQATMWLDSFSMQTPESEYRRVVRHETGHTLGFPHEHLRKVIIDRLDRAKTIAYFARMYDWTERETVSNVLRPIEEGALIATPLTDETSVMTYQLPGEITKDGRPIVGGLDINDLDHKFVSGLHPVTVPPPPPTSVTITLAADLKAGTYTLAPVTVK